MGFNSTSERQQPRVTARRDIQQDRFEEYFPRIFAYGLAATGSEETARSLTISAFAEAFALPDMREPEFELEIFRAARNVARTTSGSKAHLKDGLTGRERDVLSLVFDGQLQRDQVGSLMSLRPETVLGILLKGLRKMRDPMPAVAIPAIPEFYRA